LSSKDFGQIRHHASPIRYLGEKKHERNRFILPPELDRLIEAAKTTRAQYYLPDSIFLGAEHGASKQEVLCLRWQQNDFDYGERGIITLYRTKKKVERTEFLEPRTKEALLTWKAHLEWKREKRGIVTPESDFVFCRIDTPIKEFNKSWTSAREIAGIKDFHFVLLSLLVLNYQYSRPRQIMSCTCRKLTRRLLGSLQKSHICESDFALL
jgi:integrase